MFDSNITHYAEVPGLYMKQHSVEAFAPITKHVHPYDHYSILLKGKGTVVLTSPEGYTDKRQLVAGDILLITQGYAHTFIPTEESQWLCIHTDKE